MAETFSFCHIVRWYNWLIQKSKTKHDLFFWADEHLNVYFGLFPSTGLTEWTNGREIDKTVFSSAVFPLKVCSEMSHYLCCVSFPSRPRRRWRGRSPRWLSMTSSTSRTTTARASPPRYWTSLCGVFPFRGDVVIGYSPSVSVFCCLSVVMTLLRNQRTVTPCGRWPSWSRTGFTSQ